MSSLEWFQIFRQNTLVILNHKIKVGTTVERYKWRRYWKCTGNKAYRRRNPFWYSMGLVILRVTSMFFNQAHIWGLFRAVLKSYSSIYISFNEFPNKLSHSVNQLQFAVTTTKALTTFS